MLRKYLYLGDSSAIIQKKIDAAIKDKNNLAFYLLLRKATSLKIDLSQLTNKMFNFFLDALQENITLRSLCCTGLDNLKVKKLLNALKSNNVITTLDLNIISLSKINTKAFTKFLKNNNVICYMPDGNYYPYYLQGDDGDERYYSSKQSFPINIKIVAVGDGAVGLTCMFLRFVDGTFLEDYVPTICDKYSCNIKVFGSMFQLGLWDTAGQEEYDRFRPISYPGADIFLVCFSIVNPSSLENTNAKWWPEVTHHCPNTPIILVGNKMDLRNNPELIEKLRQHGMQPISYQKGAAWAKEIGAAAYCECSALTEEGLQELFETAVKVAVNSQINSPLIKCIERILERNRQYRVHLLTAVHEKDVNLITKIIKTKGLSIHTHNEMAQSLLHIAAYNGGIDVARFLIEQRANINAQDDLQQTPLHLAIENHKFKMVNFLLEKGADYEIPNKSGKTPYQLATEIYSEEQAKKKSSKKEKKPALNIAKIKKLFDDLLVYTHLSDKNLKEESSKESSEESSTSEKSPRELLKVSLEKLPEESSEESEDSAAQEKEDEPLADFTEKLKDYQKLKAQEAELCNREQSLEQEVAAFEAQKADLKKNQQRHRNLEKEIIKKQAELADKNQEITTLKAEEQTLKREDVQRRKEIKKELKKLEETKDLISANLAKIKKEKTTLEQMQRKNRQDLKKIREGLQQLNSEKHSLEQEKKKLEEKTLRLENHDVFQKIKARDKKLRENILNLRQKVITTQQKIEHHKEVAQKVVYEPREKAIEKIQQKLEKLEQKLHQSLLAAIESQYLEGIESQLQANLDLNKVVDGRGATALHYAAITKNLHIIQLLLKHEADASKKDKQGETPLHWAIRIKTPNNILIVLQYAEIKCELDSLFAYHNQKLLHAIKDLPLDIYLRRDYLNNLKTAVTTIEYDIANSVYLRNEKQSELDSIVKQYQLEIETCETLINEENCYTPLHNAVYYGDTTTTLALLDAGANINAAALNGVTPLHVATANCDQNMIKLLLNNGANGVLQATDKMTTPLQLFRKKYSQTANRDQQQLLLQIFILLKGAAINQKKVFDENMMRNHKCQLMGLIHKKENLILSCHQQNTGKDKAFQLEDIVKIQITGFINTLINNMVDTLNKNKIISTAAKKHLIEFVQRFAQVMLASFTINENGRLELEFNQDTPIDQALNAWYQKLLQQAKKRTDLKKFILDKQQIISNTRTLTFADQEKKIKSSSNVTNHIYSQGDDRNLRNNGKSLYYCYSLLDMYRLILKLRRTKLSYKKTNGDEIYRVKGEEYGFNRENHQHIFLPDPYYIN